MKSIGIFEAKTKLSEVCEEVARTGRPTEIRRRGEPLVRIVPLAGKDESRSEIWERVSEWEAAHPKAGDDGEFERPRQVSPERDPLENYWEDPRGEA